MAEDRRHRIPQWTHAADVLLYRCFSDVRKAVVTTVANQMLKNSDRWTDGLAGLALGRARSLIGDRRGA